tara:strand:- start:3 stop:665 length:663 start_codon:yes stop_codon:yes gene_type:complete
MAFKMRSGNKTPFKLMGAKKAPMKMMKKSPAEFNPGLKKAAADGKLDNNPKFKDAVEGAPAKMMKKSAAKLMKRPKDKKSPGEDRVKDIKKTNEAGVGTGKGMKAERKKLRKRDVAESPKPGLKVSKKNRKQSPSKMAKESPTKFIGTMGTLIKKRKADIKAGKKTSTVDKLRALGKAFVSKEGGMAVHYAGRKGAQMYRGLKAKYRRERAAKEAAKNKK